ncbi:sulfotransferase family protein [Phycicoccus sonneratiae]|uniref:Sulfotransferase n=1 Tax=Phycicoccus sonneratiae TaxID=2807628 RepID=A0ABS2CQD1_9MICO|nr:sulfotransferase [Phycicoccus sonneraticus]MBM6402076.1 sulfotransferase [Phycicoccus sonneraticus]
MLPEQEESGVVEGSRFVFVGGLHRSGTTPLARLLARHPEVAGISGSGVSEDEGVHLQDVYPPIRAHGGMGRFAHDPRAHLTEDSPLVSDENAQRLVESWSPYWDTSRRLLLEKSPGNLVMGRFLQALFPGSALVVVVRHPVVASLALEKWNPWPVARNGRRHTSLPDLVGHWVRAHELLLEDAPHHRRLLVLRYEDLVADPSARLGEVADHLGLGSPLPADGIRAGASDRYTETWEAMRTGSPLARRRRRQVEERWGEAVSRWGYSLEDLTAVGPREALPTAAP